MNNEKIQVIDHYLTNLKAMDRHITNFNNINPNIINPDNDNTNNLTIQYIKNNYINGEELKQLLNYDCIFDFYIDEIKQILKIKNMRMTKLNIKFAFAEYILTLDNRQLISCIGDIFVKIYSKKDYSLQAIWVTDVSRINFIIKTLSPTNNIRWDHDHKGIIIKNSVIQPIFNYIIETIKFYERHPKSFMKPSIKNKCTEIKDLGVHYICGKVAKYIAPKFYPKNKQIQ